MAYEYMFMVNGETKYKINNNNNKSLITRNEVKDNGTVFLLGITNKLLHYS